MADLRCTLTMSDLEMWPRGQTCIPLGVQFVGGLCVVQVCRHCERPSRGQGFKVSVDEPDRAVIGCMA